jgi:hypothetical protein
VRLYREIAASGVRPSANKDVVTAVQADHLALASAAYLKAIVDLLNAGAGSRGSYLVPEDEGVEIHPDIKDPTTEKPLRFKPENESLRTFVQRLWFDAHTVDIFRCEMTPVRPAPRSRRAFESAWADYRRGAIFGEAGG